MFWNKKKKQSISPKDRATEILQESGMYTSINWGNHSVLTLTDKVGRVTKIHLGHCKFTTYRNIGDQVMIVGNNPDAATINGQPNSVKHVYVHASSGRGKELWDALSELKRPKWII